MVNEILRIRFAEIERLARAAGLDPYDVHFFEVPAETIWQTASYGLPTRYSHWSFGKAFSYQQTQAEMGFAKIYELIINNNPSVGYLDKDNTATVNLLIAAHCFAHSHFFKHNIMFKRAGETNMVDVATQHAAIIEQFRQDYGDDEVDNWLDIALALEQHIDIYKGFRRTRYPKRQVVYKERAVKPWEDIAELMTKETEPIVTKLIKGIHIPPQPEKDILWFLGEYANIEPWQRKIFEIVRRESYYFFPQFKTKTLNEGFASFFHAEIMTQYALGNDNDWCVKDIQYPLTDEEHLDFVSYHEKVVQPGMKIPLKIEVDDIDQDTGRKVKRKVWNPRLNARLFSLATRLNPYYVGFCILRDIRKRWDVYYEQGYMENEWGDKIPVKTNGLQKVLDVAAEEDDVSFLRNYLTEEIADSLHLFSFGNIEGYKDNYDIQENIKKRSKTADLNPARSSLDSQIVKNQTVAVNSKQIKDIISSFARARNNYGVPTIVIRRIDESGIMRLEHLQDDKTNIDLRYAEQVLKYIYGAWRRPIELIRKGSDKTWTLTYDGTQFEVDYQAKDYPECIEDTDIPSSL